MKTFQPQDVDFEKSTHRPGVIDQDRLDNRPQSIWSLDDVPQISERQRKILADPMANVGGKRLYTDREIEQAKIVARRVANLIRWDYLNGSRDKPKPAADDTRNELECLRVFREKYER